MERIADLIDCLVKQGKWNESNAEAIRRRPRAATALRAGMLRHKDPLVREKCAELLREDQFQFTSGVPDLIEALRDPSVHVRFDALWTLEQTLEFDLRWWLEVEAYKTPAVVLHRKVLEWWKRNRHYVWW